MRALRKYKVGDLHRIERALYYLRIARQALAGDIAPRALAAVRRAIKSADGAKRHTERLEWREEVAHPRPPCAASMGCLCAGHARGNPADAACDTRE